MKERLSRRRFLALAGAAGLGADPLRGAIEGLISARPSSHLPRPPWVKTAAHPKMKLDDAVYGRFDKRRCVLPSRAGGSLATYVGPEAERAMLSASREALEKLSGRAGFRARDRALSAAAATVINSVGGANAANRGIMAWTATSSAEEVPPSDEWADPAAASRDVKIAARFFGAALVGVTPLDERHFYTRELDGKAIEFEDVAQPYEGADRRVIPKSCRSIVVYALRMSAEAVKRAPTAIATAGSGLTYSQTAMLGASLAAFIRSMGYLAIPCVNDTAVSIPLAVEAGLGELGRHNRLITPEYGPMVRLGKLITNVPLTPDHPIDIGVREFCRACSKCAEACPAGAISMAPEPTLTPSGPWCNGGHEAWFEDSVKCYAYTNSINTTCMICFSVCPFAKKGRAAIHSIVKTAVATTDALDGVIRSVDDAFGYGGQKSPDGWWDLDLPIFGLD